MSQAPEAGAMAEFARRMSPFVAASPATGIAVVEEFFAFCRDVCIPGAVDVVMLEWGAPQPHLLNGFTDIRKLSPEFDETEYQWVGLTRQIQLGNGDDDTALSAFLYFQPAAGDEPSSGIEFQGIDDLDAEVDRFLKKKYLAKLLGTKPSRVTAFASEVG